MQKFSQTIFERGDDIKKADFRGDYGAFMIVFYYKYGYIHIDF